MNYKKVSYLIFVANCVLIGVIMLNLTTTWNSIGPSVCHIHAQRRNC